MGNRPEYITSNTDSEACSAHSVEDWSAAGTTRATDWVAEESAIALVYNGVSHVVMMASPVDLQAFALGFSLTEGIVDSSDDIYDIAIAQHDDGIEVALTVSSRCFNRLKQRRRNLSGRSGCGICGAESLQQARLPVNTVTANFTVSRTAIDRAIVRLNDYQPLQALTGAVHGAAWCSIDGDIIHLCEDIGRHNALDKLIGLLWRDGVLQRPGFLLMSSRASYEIVQKAAQAGIAIVVAVSAPTSMAIAIARQVGITLLGFSRKNRHVVYSDSERLVE